MSGPSKAAVQLAADIESLKVEMRDMLPLDLSIAEKRLAGLQQALRQTLKPVRRDERPAGSGMPIKMEPAPKERACNTTYGRIVRKTSGPQPTIAETMEETYSPLSSKTWE